MAFGRIRDRKQLSQFTTLFAWALSVPDRLSVCMLACLILGTMKGFSILQQLIEGRLKYVASGIGATIKFKNFAAMCGIDWIDMGSLYSNYRDRGIHAPGLFGHPPPSCLQLQGGKLAAGLGSRSGLWGSTEFGMERLAGASN